MGSGDVFDAELQHVAALAACAANMRVFDEGKWKSDVGPLEFFVFTFFDIFFFSRRDLLMGFEGLV